MDGNASKTVYPSVSLRSLEGAQRVHISAKYMIMLSRSRLNIYIRASLVMYRCSRCLPTIITSSVACAENPALSWFSPLRDV